MVIPPIIFFIAFHLPVNEQSRRTWNNLGIVEKLKKSNYNYLALSSV